MVKSMRGHRFGIALVACALAATSAGAARAQGPQPTAQDQAAAEGLFVEAKKLMTDGRFAEACPKLEESNRLDPAPGTEFRLAECYEQVGRTASAWALFLNVAAAARSASMPDREQIARDRAGALEAKLSKLIITVDAPVPDLEVKRDGVVVGKAQWGTPLAIDPGKHPVTASAPGKKPWETTVDVGTGVATVKVPALADAQAAPVSPGEGAPAAQPSSGLGTQRTIALAAAGVGVVGLGVGTVFGLKGMSSLSDSEGHCTGNLCDAVGVAAREDAVAAGDLSTIAFGVGIAAIAGAAVLWFTAPKAPRDERAAQRPTGVAGTIANTLLGGTF